MMTISLVGAIALGLFLVMGKLLALESPFVYLGFFGAVVFCMLLEHLRRTRILALGNWLTASWILYRLVILLTLYCLHNAF